MRTILSTAIITLISLSCINSTKTELIVQTRNSSLYDTLKHENIVFSTPMILAIDTFRQYIQSLDNILPIEKKVLCCYFYSKEGKEYVAMQADLFYPKENIKGYTYIGEYAFVYYGEENIGNKYIDKSKLLSYHDSLPGFYSYDDQSATIYDPYGIVFQIRDSINFIVIRKGML